jgi:hypothetical protein
MLTANAAPREGNYEKSYTMAVFDAEAMKKAKVLFEEYRLNGIILNDSFGQNDWRFTNQLHSQVISFRFDELGYSKNAKPWIGCKYESFVDCAKAYVMFTMGSLTILSIREIVHSFRIFTDTQEGRLAGTVSEYISHMAAFLAALPGGSIRRDAVVAVGLLIYCFCRGGCI